MFKEAKTVGLYGGSFDPITRGHLDIIDKALSTFDLVYVSIGVNPKKTRLFYSIDESEALIRQSLAERWPMFEDPAKLDQHVRVTNFIGKTLAGYAAEIGATHLIRGLRQISDFNDEFRINGVIQRQDPVLTQTHFICHSDYLHVSSSTARELAAHREDVSWLVMPCVEQALKERF